MAIRPWVVPDDIRNYSDMERVQKRSDERLTIDIQRAEKWVIGRTGNKFGDDYPIIPNDIKLAVTLLAEHFAGSSTVDKYMQSETFKDYSYTSKNLSDDVIDDLELDYLLADYIEVQTGSKLSFRMRKL